VLTPHTVRFTRRNLPHWEVESGRYFVTVRCADSLPADAIERLDEIHRAMASVEPRSFAFTAAQRRYFLALEKYLDAGSGACLLRDPRCARLVVHELAALSEIAIAAPHFSLMPNHWHALLVFPEQNPPTLAGVMKRIKGRTGKSLRALVGGHGAVWQREWFDRWIRDDAEWSRCVDYIHDNPVKAGLARDWREHPWTQ
jgi:REP element-mobilizing transposase RayT